MLRFSMPNKMISLPTDLYDKIKNENNASLLIQSLLISYYNSQSNPKDKLEELKSEIEIKTKEAEKLNAKVQEIEKRKNDYIQEEIKKVEKEPNWERTRILQRELINNYLIDKDKREEIFEDFFNLLKEGKVKNMVDYMDSKGIKRKEVKVFNGKY